MSDPEAKRSWRRASSAWLGREGLLLLAVAAYALPLLARLQHSLRSDTWLALVAGREIVQHGLPRHDALTAWTLGDRWVDQQWLAQLTLYGLERVGGLRLVL